LACRTEELGQRAVQELQAEGCKNCEFRQLDISSTESIERFVDSVKRDYNNSVDILVNNAGIAFKNADPTPFQQQVRPTVMTNYFGTYELTTRMIPLLRNAKRFGRLVNVASEAGHLRIIKSPELQDQFTNIHALTLSNLNDLMNQFITVVENGTHSQGGWPNTCYGMSKIGVIAMTKRLAFEEEAKTDGTPRVLVTCCCPGYCSTDMSSHRGTKTAEEGARTPAFLALQPEFSAAMNGKFFSSEKEIEW
jgi:carbonyl reductase 1